MRDPGNEVAVVLVTLKHMVVENKKRRIPIKSNQTAGEFPVIQRHNCDEFKRNILKFYYNA